MSDTDPFLEETTPEEDAYLAYLLGGESDIYGSAAPSLSPATYESLASLMPYAEPGEDAALDLYGSQLTQFKKAAGVAMDPYLAGQAGPGAFAPDTFNPIVRTGTVDRPGYREVAGIAASDPTSWQGQIATALLGGNDAQSVINRIQQEAARLLREEGEESDAYQNYIAVLPIQPDGQGGFELDTFFMRNEAQRLQTAINADPTEGVDPETGAERVIDPDTGVMYETISEEAPMAEYYRERGLPSPTDELTPEYIFGPEWAAAAQQLPQAHQAIIDADVAYNALLQAQRDFADQTPPAAPLRPTEVQPTEPPRYDFPTGLNAPGGDVIAAPGPSDVQTTVDEVLPHDRGAWQEWMATVYPTLDPATQESVAQRLGELGQSGLLPGQRQQPSVLTRGEGADAEQLTPPDILPADVNAWPEWMATVYPTLNPEDQDAVDVYMATSESGGGGGTRLQAVNLDRFLAPKGVDEPPRPPIDMSGGGEFPTTPQQYPNRQAWEAAQQLPQQYPNRQAWEAAQQPPQQYPNRQAWEAAQPPAPPPSDGRGAFLPGAQNDPALTQQLLANRVGTAAAQQPSPANRAQYEAMIDAMIRQGQAQADEYMANRVATAAATQPPQPPPGAATGFFQSLVDEGRTANANQIGAARAAQPSPADRAGYEAMIDRLIRTGEEQADEYMANRVATAAAAQPPQPGAATGFFQGLVDQGRATNANQVGAARAAQPSTANRAEYEAMIDSMIRQGQAQGDEYMANRIGTAAAQRPSAANRADYEAYIDSLIRTGEEQADEYMANRVATAAAQRPPVRPIRTGEERATLARTKAPEEPEYDPLSGQLTRAGRAFGSERATRDRNVAHQAWREAAINWDRSRKELYAGRWGAMGQAAGLRAQGITPYMLTVAARQQIPMAAGITNRGRTVY